MKEYTFDKQGACPLWWMEHDVYMCGHPVHDDGFGERCDLEDCPLRTEPLTIRLEKE
jgi:hypothetical protein